MSLSSRLDKYLSTNGLEAVWFAQPNSFEWLAGGSNVIARSGNLGSAAVGYDGNSLIIVTNNIEAKRLYEEELHHDVQIVTYEWYKRDLGEAVASISPTPAAADFGIEAFEKIDASTLRQPLLDEQIETYRRLSRETAETVERVVRQTHSGATELDVAADLRGELEAQGIATPVILIGGATRAQQYRHFTPTDAKLGEYALISVTVSRDGLYTSATRTVAFNDIDWLSERTQAAMRVETTALAATQAVGTNGGTADDVFDAIREAYDEVGWDGEWQNHHQGGAAGFAPREWIGKPDCNESIFLPQGYAWNPTVQGTKSEDTYLVTATKIEMLSATGEWPTTTVEAVGYDLELDRHDVLFI
jgi:Xaa-Pro aminopeptidase